MPEPYPSPVQRQPFQNYRPYRPSRIVEMADGDANTRFVQDIFDNLQENWRWTGQRPTVRIVPRAKDNLKYVIDFALPEATFKDTGPVTLSFYVNDRLLDRVRYTAAGQFHFEKAVPSEWITPGNDTTLAAEIDKMWISKEDGARLGFILTRIGLIQ